MRTLTGPRFFRKLVLRMVTYSLLTMTMSTLVLLRPSEVTYPINLSIEAIISEFISHGSFGLLSGIFTFNPLYILSTTSFAVLIDLDHLLWITGLPVTGRPSHSIPFLLIASLVMGIIFRGHKRFNIKAASATAAGILSHLAFDSFVEKPVLPLLMPITSEQVILPPWAWISFEVAAITIALFGFIIDRIITKRTEKQLTVT